MYFLQLELPEPQNNWTQNQLLFLKEGLQRAQQTGEIVVYLNGDYCKHSMISLCGLINTIYVLAFHFDRYLEVFVCFGNTEHPLLRLSSVRHVFLPFDTSSLERLNAERKDVGFCPVSSIVSSNTELQSLTSSSLESILSSLHKSYLPDESASLPPPKETVTYNLDSTSAEIQSKFYYSYKNIAYGGTFDRFHPGHKLLLTICTLLGQDIIHIGLIVPELLKGKTGAAIIQSYTVRKANLTRFFSVVAPHLHIRITRMVEPIGDVQRVKQGIDCTVLSQETGAAIPFIEKAREDNAREELLKSKQEGDPAPASTEEQPSQQRLAPPMTYIVIPLVPDDAPKTDTETTKISSTTLRLLDS